MNHFLLLPIEIVVRKFRFDNFFIRLTLSFALPLIYSLSIVNELSVLEIPGLTGNDDWQFRSAIPYNKKRLQESTRSVTLIAERRVNEQSSKKEVFQPHLPVRLPCYDLAPITCFALGRSSRSRTSGAPDFHGLTGGVYKARERIHRAMADARLLANPASRSRVADSDPD